MFRAAARIPPAQRRSFVSSVLLTRTWENESVADIRKELKNRGLPVKGNKATLILRIQEHEKKKTLGALRDPSVVRKMSSAPAGVSPGIPPVSESQPAQTQDFLNVTLPDLWQPVPEIPVQIPYVPDFWDSSAQAPRPAAEEPLPKLNVIAGADTHLSGGPSHNLHDENAAVLASPQTPLAPKPTTDDGILGDITDDLGLPRPQEIKAAFWKILS
ncbi:hypothetical protein E4T56_gene19378 [Termitomyces sp. T112]|nr:hypothetical protein C0989_008735 [Termitomyces sp. Mn162]KAG5728013.1 hypothetical protein E4T56_gene19378 [Termitomyces sp. T112]